MRLRLNLQWKVLLLVAGTMTTFVVASAYLHSFITRTLSEEYRYNNAVRQVATVAKRAESGHYLAKPEDRIQEIQFLVNSRPDFDQIDVYETVAEGERLVASTDPSGIRLPALNEASPDNELREMERPLPGIVSMEIDRNGRRNWVISVAFSDGSSRGYVSALVQKSSRTDFISRLQFQQNVVLAIGSLLAIALLYLLF